MKKRISALLVTLIFYYVAISDLTAQVPDKNYIVSVDNIKRYLDYEKSGEFKSFLELTEETKASKADYKAVKANSRAAQNLKREFKDASNITWMLIKDGIIGSFTKDEVKTTVIYDTKGRWIQTLKYISENKMPKDVTSVIRSFYPGYQISLLVEVQEQDLIFYIIEIHDTITLKQLGLYNGQINKIKELKLTNL